MSDSELRSMLENLRLERDVAMLEYQRARNRLQNLIQAVEGLEGIVGKPDDADKSDEQPVPSQPGRPLGAPRRGQGAVEAVLRETPRQWWTVPDLTRELVGRGWATAGERAEEPVRAALKRVIEKMNGQVQTNTRRFPHKYRFMPHDEEEP